MMIKMVIFDLDGVLVDACEWHRIALNDALKKSCNYVISLEDHHSLFNGIPTKVKLKKLTAMGIIPIDKHKEIYEHKQASTIKIINEKATIDETKIQMISKLQKKGIIVACYTNSIRETAHLMLEKTGIKEMFDFILTNQDVEKPKPSPEGYLFLIKKFKIKPEQVIIVEDSEKGLQSAYATGCCVKEVKNATEVNTNLFKEII